ncbi:MAG: response regulator [Bryobacteraceae bacterium]|nr:response regulator [Bryobacteraceae bacterium]
MAVDRILIVDDESSLLGLLEKYLQRMGYSVVACSTAAEGWKSFSPEPDQYALAVIDYSLPDRNGDSLLGEMLALRPDLPAVLCSGYPIDISDIPAGPGQLEALQKPFTPRMLGEVIQRLLAQEPV